MIQMRDVRPEDKKRIRQWRNLPEVAKYMYTDHHITSSEHEKWFQRILDEPTCRYWIIVCDGKDVGLANISKLDRRNKRCDWAFYVADPSTRGRGVGSYVEYFVLCHVFNEIGLNKLCCEVLEFNELVTNLHMSFGFRQEGLLREHVFKGGLPHNVVALSMLRSEWKALQPRIEERLRAKGLLSTGQVC
jgi:UDP-4-amino-4,6-dideoxy-N-acetyl-beta-L-altrosamine N-acetyltransferase